MRRNLGEGYEVTSNFYNTAKQEYRYPVPRFYFRYVQESVLN